MAKRGLSIEEIKRQSGHEDLDTLIGYIQLSDEEVKVAYLRGISLDEKKEPKPSEPQEPKIKPPQQKPKTEAEYYHLLKEGLITPEQYKELIDKKGGIQGYQ